MNSFVSLYSPRSGSPVVENKVKPGSTFTVSDARRSSGSCITTPLLGFRSDLDLSEQREVIRDLHQEQRQEQNAVRNGSGATKGTPLIDMNTKRHQACSLAMGLVEATKYQRLHHQKQTDISVHHIPDGVMRPQGGINLLSDKVVAMVLHDIHLLVDNMDDTDHFAEVKGQLVKMGMWMQL